MSVHTNRFSYASTASLLTALGTLLVASGAPAQEPLTLDEAVDAAIARAPQVDSRTAALAAAESLVVAAGRLPDPQLVLGVENLPVDGPDAWSMDRDFMTMRKLGVMQEFPRARKRRLQRDLAGAEVTAMTAELADERLTVAREAATAWLRRATVESALTELRALEPEVELQAVAARAAVSAGRTSTAEALAADAAAAELAIRILGLQSEARRASIELARWINADATRPLGAMPSLDELPTPPSALLASVHEHGALLPYASQVEAARIAVDLARAGRRPDVSAELAYAQRGADFSDMISLEIRVGLPLFAKHRQDPIVSARHAELRRIEAEREREVRMHTAELNQMIAEWELLGQELQQYEQELLPLARERSRTALASYRAGRGDLRLALDAYREEVEYLLKRAELQSQRGRAWAFLRYVGPQHLKR